MSARALSYASPQSSRQRWEAEANIFARNILIPANLAKRWLQCSNLEKRLYLVFPRKQFVFKKGAKNGKQKTVEIIEGRRDNRTGAVYKIDGKRKSLG